jgi:hypothetical protein
MASTTSEHGFHQLPAVLDWLEESLFLDVSSEVVSVDELADEDILRMMPEDPDEALAWLVQMASDEIELPSKPQIAVEPESETWEPVVVEATHSRADSQPEIRGSEITSSFEADLMDMPEDPDEAMLWLEGLAQQSEDKILVPQIETAAGETQRETSKIVISPPETIPAIIPEQLSVANAPSPRRPSRRMSSGSAWVDLLKPLEK